MKLFNTTLILRFMIIQFQQFSFNNKISLYILKAFQSSWMRHVEWNECYINFTGMIIKDFTQMHASILCKSDE